jgi:hypothetical protein
MLAVMALSKIGEPHETIIAVDEERWVGTCGITFRT